MSAQILPFCSRRRAEAGSPTPPTRYFAGYPFACPFAIRLVGIPLEHIRYLIYTSADFQAREMTALGVPVALVLSPGEP